MRTITFLLTLLLTSISALASQECTKPTPPTIPDGKKATENELLDAMDAVKVHVASGEDYRKCLDKKIEANLASENPDPEIDKKLTGEYNTSVEMDEKLSSQFNQQIKAYKNNTSKNNAKKTD